MTQLLFNITTATGGPRSPRFPRFTITLNQTDTICETPLDECSTRRTDVRLT